MFYILHEYILYTTSMIHMQTNHIQDYCQVSQDAFHTYDDKTQSRMKLSFKVKAFQVRKSFSRLSTCGDLNHKIIIL